MNNQNAQLGQKGCGGGGSLYISEILRSGEDTAYFLSAVRCCESVAVVLPQNKKIFLQNIFNQKTNFIGERYSCWCSRESHKREFNLNVLAFYLLPRLINVKNKANCYKTEIIWYKRGGQRKHQGTVRSCQVSEDKQSQ